MKCQLNQRLFIRPCTRLCSAEPGQYWTSSDTMFCTSLSHPNLAPNSFSCHRSKADCLERERKHMQRQSLCLSRYQHKDRGLPSTRAGPGTVADPQPGWLIRTCGQHTCYLTRLLQGSPQNPPTTTKEFRKCSKLIRWQMRTAKQIFSVLREVWYLMRQSRARIAVQC